MKSGLGRGLDALIRPQVEHEKPVEQSNVSTSGEITRVQIYLIDPNPFQPRTVFDPAALDELKKSILVNGLIQPVTLRKMDTGRYQIVSGERRFRACKEIGYTDIPAYVIKVESDELMLAMALIENIQREKLNPIEEAKAYKRLMEECSLTQEEIAERVGKDRTTIANAIRLLKLPRDIQQSMIDEKITMGHARALINVPGEAMQLRVLQKIIEDQLSVRSVESLVRKMLTEKKPEKHNPAARNPFGGNALADVEDRLRKTMGTKVYVKSRKNNQGEICIEYYSLDDFDRLIELFDVIQKNSF